LLNLRFKNFVRGGYWIIEADTDIAGKRKRFHSMLSNN